MRLFESFTPKNWKQDQSARTEAVSVLVRITNTLKAAEQRGTLNTLFHPRDNDGGLITNGKILGLSGENQRVVFVFMLKKPGEFGSLSFVDGYPVILLYALNNVYDPVGLYKNIEPKSFVHEWIHLMDFRETKGLIQGPPIEMMSGKTPFDAKIYLNNPAEFNAHFQEGMFQLQDAMLNAKKSTVEMIVRNGKDRFIGGVKKTFFTSFFIDNLNAQYMKILDTKLGEFFDQAIPEMLKLLESRNAAIRV